MCYYLKIWGKTSFFGRKLLPIFVKSQGLKWRSQIYTVHVVSSSWLIFISSIHFCLFSPFTLNLNIIMKITENNIVNIGEYEMQKYHTNIPKNTKQHKDTHSKRDLSLLSDVVVQPTILHFFIFFLICFVFRNRK